VNIFIIAIIGIVAFLAIFFVLFPPQNDGSLIPQIIIKPEHYDIEITGLKDTYLVGEPYSFSYILYGFGDPCGGTMITFPINKTDSSGTGSIPSCLKTISTDFVLDVKKTYGTTYGHIALQETGNYTVKITFEKGSKGPTVATKNFLVAKDCNDLDGRKEAQCFEDSLESCTFAKTNDVMYTIEGDPGYLEGIIKADCKIHITFDNSEDRFAGPDKGITNDICNDIELQESLWIIGNCTFPEQSEFQIGYQAQDYASHKKCTDLGGEWNYDYHNCTNLADVICQSEDGKSFCMSYEQAGHGRDICSAICEFVSMDRK
jgi:hypothetical protein